MVNKPLSEGGNYIEVFAPVIFIQKYQTDAELAHYFESPEYTKHAMYLTLYGTSKYLEELVGKEVNGTVLHPKDTYLHNTHLHAPGIERGTEAYGGYSRGASNFSIGGVITDKPTLPQRDIFEQVANPLYQAKIYTELQTKLPDYTKREERKVEKILRLHHDADVPTGDTTTKGLVFADTESLNTTGRFTQLEDSAIYHLLTKPNVEFIATLNPADSQQIKILTRPLANKSSLDEEVFKTELYAIPKEPEMTKKQINQSQLRFFKNVYWLLFNSDSGPRLAPFLYEIDNQVVDNLLNV